MRPLVVMGRAALLPGQASLTTFEPARPARLLTSNQLTQPPGMQRFGRLDRFGQALASVCEAGFKTVSERRLAHSGLSVVSRYANFETNATYHHGLLTKGPTMASPLLFPYTLPGSAASEAAMHWGLGGNYLVWPGGPATALASALDATDALTDHPEHTITLLSADVLGPALWRTLDECQAFSPFGQSEAAALICLGAQPTQVGQRIELEGALGSGHATPQTLTKLITQALDRAGLPSSAVQQIISASAHKDALARENQALLDVGLTADFLRLAVRWGDCGASLGYLALQAAFEASGTTLVLATDNAASVALVIVTIDQ